MGLGISPNASTDDGSCVFAADWRCRQSRRSLVRKVELVVVGAGISGGSLVYNLLKHADQYGFTFDNLKADFS